MPMGSRQESDTLISRRARLVPGLTAALAALGALAFLLWTAILWYRYHTHIPWRDLYLIVAQIKPLFSPGFGPEHLMAWFELHYNAHRIFMLRSLVALDMLWFSGQNHLLYAAGWLCLLGSVLGFGCAIRAHHWPDKATPLFAIFLVAFYLFSPSHLWNILNPVNVSWHLTVAGAMAAFALLLFKQAPPGIASWLGALLLASVAAFSTFAGVIAWLMLPVLALYLRSRYFIPVSAACIGATLLYCQGITSDATVLANWSGGSTDAVESIQAQGRELLAAHTPRQVVVRAIAFLGWPLAREHSLVATLLVSASLLLVGWALWQVTHRWWLGRERPGRLFEFALATAMLCVAIALVTQFGRIITQPVHVQGPSQERFQSIVLLYWACISLLLLLIASVRARTRLPGFGLPVLLALAVLLTVPGGAYLKEEILSMEYAARLHSHGERESLRERVDKKSLVFRPERIFKLDDFLAEHQLAYKVPLTVPAADQVSGTCDSLQNASSATVAKRRNLQPVVLRFQGLQGMMAREVLVVAGPFTVARLYPVHTGDYRPLDLLAPDKLTWQGMVQSRASDQTASPVYLRLPTGIRPVCRLSLAATRH